MGNLLKGAPLSECLERYPSTKKDNWSKSQIQMVVEAAESGVRKEMAFELLGIVEKASERFIETMTSLQDGDSVSAPRRDTLSLMTSNPDLTLAKFLSAEMPATHALTKFADIDKSVPDGPGIYRIWTFCGEALKVGISTNLRERLRKHRASRSSALKLKPGGNPENPDDWVSKASILAKHLYFDRTLTKEFDLTTENGRRCFLEKACEITFFQTASKEKARELEKTLERSEMFRYQGKVRVR